MGKYDSLHDIVMKCKARSVMSEICQVLKQQYSGTVPLAAEFDRTVSRKYSRIHRFRNVFMKTFSAGRVGETASVERSKKKNRRLPGDAEEEKSGECRWKEFVKGAGYHENL